MDDKFMQPNRSLSNATAQATAWTIATLVSVLAFIAWGDMRDWNFTGLNAYALFPILGLIAFSLMLTHYVMGTIRRYAPYDRSALNSYFHVTGYIILACILLHPGLLIWQLWQDNFGLPPLSYWHYVAAGSRLFLLLGNIALFAFLAFEFKRAYAGRSWWWIIERANDVAMVFIFLHGLKLGSHMHVEWYKAIWYVYGLVLLISLASKAQVYLSASKPSTETA
jgi:hypothetical protein